MHRDSISFRNSCFLIIIMVAGNSMNLGFPTEVRQDTWIAFLTSLLGIIPLVLVYARMIKLMPGKDIYEMTEYALGRFPAKVVGVLFGGYCLHLAALVISNCTQFVHLTSLLKTPQIVIALTFFSACLYLAKSGVQTLGKWCALMVVFTVATIVGMSAVSTSHMHMENLMPVMEHSVSEILVAAAKLIPYPFAESVVVLGLLGGLEKDSNPYSLYILSSVASAVMLVMIFARTCAILGASAMDTAYMSAYKAASVIEIGNFLERVEVFLGFAYIMSGISKVAACIISAAKGYAKLFELPSHNSVILPVGFLALALSMILFRNSVEATDFGKTYIIYAIPFQMLIPICIWIAAEIRAKLQRRPLSPPLPT